ncbi:MAG: hypothetical protein U5R49_13095 [Deltaproteobacteria bacterium]|nr:hypothetical protein [Deltaproteobacteria bacterium]
MKEIIRITVALTISCLMAGLLMGSVFIITDKAKKHNEQVNEHRTMLQLIGYSKRIAPPTTSVSMPFTATSSKTGMRRPWDILSRWTGATVWGMIW